MIATTMRIRTPHQEGHHPMKISASDAALLTARERAMVQSTGPWHVSDLVSLIKRLRDLRDKQRQLGQRQVIASARAAKGKAAAGNARTLQKGRVLDRALKHFEGELDAINRQSSAASSELKVKGKPAKKASPKKLTGKKAAVAKSAAKKAASEKSAANKPAAKKASAKKAAAKKPTAKKAGASKAAKKAPAKKAASKTAATKTAPRKGPKRKVSAKARIKLPKGGRGDAPSQVASLPSRHKAGRRSR